LHTRGDEVKLIGAFFKTFLANASKKNELEKMDEVPTST
jgi:hypothetical protein